MSATAPRQYLASYLVEFSKVAEEQQAAHGAHGDGLSGHRKSADEISPNYGVQILLNAVYILPLRIQWLFSNFPANS